MSIELALPKPDRLADDLAAILGLGEDRPAPQRSRGRGARGAVLLAGLLVAASAIAIFLVARPPSSGGQPDRGSADRTDARGGGEAPAERTVATVATVAPAGDRREVATAAPPATLPPPARRSKAVAAAPVEAAPPRREAPRRVTVAASRPVLSPAKVRDAKEAKAKQPAAAPRRQGETNVAAARPAAPAVAPVEEARIAPVEAPAGREQVASAASASASAAVASPADAGDGGRRSKRVRTPAEERKVREGVDALRLLRRQ